MDPTQSNETPPVASTTSDVLPGVQQRISELTGIIKEQREQNAQMNSTVQELMGQMAATQARMPQQQAPQMQIPEGIDPSMAEFFSKMMGSALAQQSQQLEQKFNQAFGSVRQSQEVQEFQQMAGQADKQVADLAGNLLASWKRSGHTGWKVEDAFTYAEGVVAKQRRNPSNRPNGEEGTYNGGSPTPQPTRTLPPAKSDAELKGMSPTQQEAYWAGRVGNSEINY